ncbi:threonine synthase [Rhodococcus sp. Leaf7]|uniref:threonine synthase n=1 Tax=unclassified Rhodococcus (in: high G+C Gram-positive bacteria) TaxID=192944 RepID=UPI0006F1D2F5|nr:MULTISPECIES: threonine synthase [unclassified Rhodococcus (in: high G+C Gram-positive bacteria)]KQU04433.1 threonine synthase [Rhodococcus sp. Leaf7]KQU40618.1 threonine synthase [Rhodococcus sp. Leaf247]
MQYQSTRGHNLPQHFSDILLGGLAPDGGLYLPSEYPQLTADELESWRGLSYADLAFAVLSKFADDIPADDLHDITRRTYTAEVYCNGREGDDVSLITPLRTLGDEDGAPLKLLGLSNGPTLAFKDMAMQLIGNLFEYTLAASGNELNILGATSGDTGSAAEHAMRGKNRIRVVMLSPHGRMSSFQRAQMFSLQDDNIVNLAVEGNFDDCQDIVKAVSKDAEFKAHHAIGTVNSINWARVVAQVVYYVHGWLLATDGPGQKVSFSVPSGNFGNVCAGHIARCMGLPIDQLVVATNENDVLDEFFRTGVYRPRSPAETHHTSSPSMDISKASNFERFLYDLVDQDAARLGELFRALDTDGGFDFSGTAEFDRIAEFGFVSGRSTHADRVATIRDVKDRYGVTIDPHTADGVVVARRNLREGIPMIVLETALPAKFADIVREALGEEPERPAAFDGIEDLPQRFDVVPADVERVKAVIVEHTAR